MLDLTNYTINLTLENDNILNLNEKNFKKKDSIIYFEINSQNKTGINFEIKIHPNTIVKKKKNNYFIKLIF